MATPDATILDRADHLVDPNGWEPATFVMSCSRDRKHRDWDSRGRWHARSSTPAPDQPLCPSRGCGHRFGPIVTYTGPNRPGVVENRRG